MKKETLLPALIIKNPFDEPPKIAKRMAWSPSKLKLFRKCKRKCYWKTIMRLSPKSEAKPFVISNLVHAGLAEWYSSKRGSMKKIASRLVGEKLKEIEANARYYDQEEYDDIIALLQTVEGMLIGYSRVYADDRKKWSLAKRDIEAWFSVNMGAFDFKGKIDILPLSGNTQLLGDHKAVKNINESYIERLPLDTQLRGYILGATEDLGRKPKRVLYNLIRKCSLRRKSDETIEEFCERIADDYETRVDFYFRRESLKYSSSDIEAFKFDLRKTHQEYAALVNNSVDPLDPREWVCSDHICDEFFRTCPYLPLCLQGLDKGTGALYTQYNKEKSVDEEV